jgi:hypothetical protein
MADATDLKSVDPKGSCGFESRHRYTSYIPQNQEIISRNLGLSRRFWPPADCGSKQGIDNLLTLCQDRFVGLRYPEELGHLTIAQIHNLKVRPYPFSKTSPWCITGLRNKNGKRARFFFKTKSDATAELDRIKIKFRDAGEKALEVTDELRLAALKCARRLEAYGKTIVDATDH